MPLRDHFRSPVNDKHTWDSVHGGWPMMIVKDLYDILPQGYEAAPTVHLGSLFEIDISTFENNAVENGSVSAGGGGVATAIAPEPTLTLEAELFDQDEYEVRIYDAERDRQLVAAIEIVSPSNKDRPENRRAFVDKVVALIQKEVCVSIVDLVTIRQFNLYDNVLELIGHKDSKKLAPTLPCIYAVTIRARKRAKKPFLLDFWHYPMELGQPLPTLPIWLSPDLRVLLPLETSYEETCRLLHIQ